MNKTTMIKSLKRVRLKLLFTIGLFVISYGLLATGCSNDAAEKKTVTFTNIAQDVGLDFQHGSFRWEMSGDPVAMMGSGLCWLDYDGDGWLDLYVVNSYAVLESGEWDRNGGKPESTLYRNENGRFTNVGAETGTNFPIRGNGCVAADLNLDGHTDIFITTSRVNLLLWNNGDGTFSEGAELAGVNAYGWQTAVSIGDLNGDSWPDIFVAGYVDINNQIEGATMGFPNTNYGMRDLLYISEGPDENRQVSFREVGEAVGLETAEFEYGLGSVFSDFDGDGDLDLYVANDTNPNRLYENRQLLSDPSNIGIRFDEIGAQSATNDTNSGMGVASGDMDGDGRSDLFVTNMGHQLHSVYQNQSGTDVTFSDWAPTMGIPQIGAGWTGWGTSWADFDLDSDLDLFVANGAIPVLDLEADKMQAQLFENLTAQEQAGQFSDWSQSAGIEGIGPILARGSAVADFDNDGDLDIAINQTGGELLLLENEQQGGNWLMVDLGANASGAVVTAVLPDGTELTREMLTGSSYLSSEDPRCHFGLGEFQRVSRLIITWPDQTETVLRRVRSNQIISASNS
ncbi:MAG: CRTAC1 family protein [Chloroflexota bacterium]